MLPHADSRDKPVTPEALRNRAAVVLFLIVVVFVGAYFGSPYWVLRQIRAAADAGEADRLAVYVDFPAVRESVKTQLQAMMAKRMQSEKTKDNPLSAMGLALAGGMVNVLVDAMINARSLANMVKTGKARPVPFDLSLPGEDKSSTDRANRPRVDTSYEGLDVFKVEMHDRQTNASTMTLVLNREGVFRWKLKAVRIPALSGE